MRSKGSTLLRSGGDNSGHGISGSYPIFSMQVPQPQVQSGSRGSVSHRQVMSLAFPATPRVVMSWELRGITQREYRRAGPSHPEHPPRIK